MAYDYMLRINPNGENKEGWYHTINTMTSGTYGTTYVIPDKGAYAIGIQITGSGSWMFSLSSTDALKDDSAIFARWDGESGINLAVTGFKMIRDSGTVTGTVTVKTLNP